MLYKGGSSSKDSGVGHQDIFGTSVIDTLVAEVQSVPGDDRCVLLLGYEGPMREMFQVSALGVEAQQLINKM